MGSIVAHPEPTIVRQVFPHWSITIPAAFAETFVEEDGYWHAWDARRSVSLTSLLITDRRGRPVTSRRILKRFPTEPGDRVAMPPDLDGWAVGSTQLESARASRGISGLIAMHGRVLIATMTAENLAWAAGVWQSIRADPHPSEH